MRKVLITSISLLILASCTKNIDSANTETKRPSSVPAGTLFTGTLKTLSDGLANASVNINVWRFTVKHWAMTTYQDEARYDFTTRRIPNAWWNRMYRDVLNNLVAAGKIVTADAQLPEAEKANKLAILDIMQVYTFSILVSTFGNVPYSDAVNDDILFPKYDDAKTVYADLMKRLAADIPKLTAGAPGFNATEDVVYKGSVAKWIKFANSLQIRMAMTIADVDDATAKSSVESADANAFQDATDNAALVYLAGSPNQNPLFVDIITGNRGDYVASKDLMDLLVAMSDPRLPGFFQKNNAGEYKGGVVGDNNTIQNTSQPSLKVSAADAPSFLLDYVETEFYRAEAKERGYNVTGTAEEHYNKAITASILFWGGTAADAAAYLARPDVAYTTAAGDWKQKIGTQKWFALYNRPYEGWTELRRLDYPKLTPVVNAKTPFPNRFTYPGDEQQTNGGSYTAAAAAIGGDKPETKLFWDKF
jgi:hypothetical protein